MTDTTLAAVLQSSTAAMVDAHDDTIGPLAALLSRTVDAVGAQAGGILVRMEGGTAELLVATSHRATDLELAQLQAQEGPCLDAIETGRPVVGRGREDLIGRWPQTGRRVVEAGFEVVHALPLTWRDTAFGGLNLFWVDATAEPADVAEHTRALADAATLLILSKGALPDDALGRAVAHALEDRVVVEQAKGALGYVRSLDPESAYDALVELGRSEGLTVGEAARLVVERAERRTLT
ncbi:ANTAR domain-containing protein [Phycicoccus avicenniae]|uniref:ANTAR domain-containing protein n=1 Tax=Phycicoccus avicenniae TaxID=2828860 RepID=UPI003D29A140